MCLIINSKGFFLSHQDYLVAYKNFKYEYYYLYSGWEISLRSYVLFELYQFEVMNDLVVAKNADIMQPVQFQFIIQNNHNSVVEKFFRLGYHLYLFSDNNIKECFGVEAKKLTLPVFIRRDWVQFIADNVVVSERFGIPNREMYLEICKNYGIEPDHEIIRKLYEIYKSPLI